jgi:hypothetical protein
LRVGSYVSDAFGASGLLRQVGEIRDEFVFGKDAVVVGVDGVELLLDAVGGLGLGELAVLVGVPLVEYVLGAIGGSLLAGPEFGGRELSVAVFVEGLKCGGCGGDLGSGEDAVVVGVDGGEYGVHAGGFAGALWTAVGACLRGGRGTNLVGDELAITVCIGAGEEALEALGNLVFGEGAVAVFVEGHETLDGLIGFVGGGVRLTRKVFEGRQLAVVVGVE